jgi:hypothetical protein
MSQFDELIQNPPAAAGLSLLIGFTGSVVGLVYGWGYLFDRAWFILWFLTATYFAIAGVRKWLSAESFEGAHPADGTPTADGLGHGQTSAPPVSHATAAHPSTESRTLEQDSADHDLESRTIGSGADPRIEK